MMNRLILLLLAPIFLINSNYAQNLQIEPYTFENAKGEKIEAELGSFQVLEKRSNPDSKKLTLRFVRFRSTAANPGHPIIYLAGGPGGSGIGTARGSRFDLFMKMREIGDVIAFDQRGTGMSDGLPEYPGFYLIDPSKVMTLENASAPIKEETIKMEQFFKEQGHDISGYNSNESADDMDELRIALGAEKLNVWGISYGSHLALTYLKRHEEHVDKLLIAGIEGYDHTVKLPSDQQELLVRIDSLVKSSPESAEAFPDFIGDLTTLLERVDAEPVLIETQNPLTKEPIEMKLGKLDLQILLSWYLGGPDSFKDLPLHVSQMLEGDFSSLSEYAIYTRIGRMRGMNIGMDIASGISYERRKRIEKESNETLLGDAINFPYFIQQEALSHLDLGEAFRSPFKSQVPALCISGTLDGRTDVKNADFTLKTLPNGHHLIIEGAGHSDPLFLSSPKIAEYMLAFMKGKDIGNPKITLEPMKFLTN